MMSAPFTEEVLLIYWPRKCKYALLPMIVLHMIRDEQETLLLVALRWPNQPWFSDIIELLTFIIPDQIFWTYMCGRSAHRLYGKAYT